MGYILIEKGHFLLCKRVRFREYSISPRIKIDPPRVEAIQKINSPRNKKEVLYFLRNNFSKKVHTKFCRNCEVHYQYAKKNSDIKWIEDAKNTFATINLALSESPVLINLD